MQCYELVQDVQWAEILLDGWIQCMETVEIGHGGQILQTNFKTKIKKFLIWCTNVKILTTEGSCRFSYKVDDRCNRIVTQHYTAPFYVCLLMIYTCRYKMLHKPNMQLAVIFLHCGLLA